MFKDNDFEIYEAFARLQIERDEEIKGLDRNLLQMREVLNAIKEKYYEIIEHTADWTAKKKAPHIQRWLNWLAKLTEPIRGQAVEEALEEIQDEITTSSGGGGGGGDGGGGGWKRQRDEKKKEDDDEEDKTNKTGRR